MVCFAAVTAGHRPRSNEMRGGVVIVPEIRESVELWSANGRVAPVASMPKCDTSRSARITDCHDRVSMSPARQFALWDHPREVKGARDESRLARLAISREEP